MKQIKIKLKNNKAIILNKETIYIEENEEIKVVVTNKLEPGDKLFFNLNDEKSKKVDGNTFHLNEENIRDVKKVKITLQSASKMIPDLFLLDFKQRNILVIGDTIDKKYPEIIQVLFKEIKELKKVSVLLNDKIERLEKKGVIE